MLSPHALVEVLGDHTVRAAADHCQSSTTSLHCLRATNSHSVIRRTLTYALGRSGRARLRQPNHSTLYTEHSMTLHAVRDLRDGGEGDAASAARARGHCMYVGLPSAQSMNRNHALSRVPSPTRALRLAPSLIDCTCDCVSRGHGITTPSRCRNAGCHPRRGARRKA